AHEAGGFKPTGLRCNALTDGGWSVGASPCVMTNQRFVDLGGPTDGDSQSMQMVDFLKQFGHLNR
ncbi:hypothetical protein, partial [Salmonella enterica]|uniref:hypothetical protein n=1 Tax=Salmonella enterica TaxID=28901 RepID=UPI003CF288C3